MYRQHTAVFWATLSRRHVSERHAWVWWTVQHSLPDAAVYPAVSLTLPATRIEDDPVNQHWLMHRIGEHTHRSPTALSAPSPRPCLPATPRRSFARSRSRTRRSDRSRGLVACTRRLVHREATRRDRRPRGCTHRRGKTGWRRQAWCSASGTTLGVQERDRGRGALPRGGSAQAGRGRDMRWTSWT